MTVAKRAIAWLGGLRSSIAYLIRKGWLTPSPDRQQGEYNSAGWPNFGSYPERRARYSLLWSLAQGTIFWGTEVHIWLDTFKADFHLSPNVRTIFNQVYRLVEFWATHIYAGSIDPECGDGSVRPSAIPIETRNEDLRPLIARIFQDSEWETNKTVFCRLGAALGDVALFAVDDVQNGRTYIEVIDPNSIVDYEDDGLGTCYRYTIEEWRADPRDWALTDQYGKPKQVIYREEGQLLWDEDGKPSGCQFSTWLIDGGRIEYDWTGQGVQWEEPYPFVPLVLVPHTKQIPRIPFGQSECMPVLGKILELEDVASRFHDFIGKAVDPVWLLRGVKEPEGGINLMGGKNGLPILYGGDSANAQALLASLDLPAVDGHLEKLKKEIEADFPELRRDIENAAGDASGVALRVAQQRIETKAQSRRAGYDAALKNVLTYCLRIGRLRRYEGFETLADDADLTFRIADRPVFRSAKLDEMLLDKEFWAMAESADRAGVPIQAFLTLRGWPQARIDLVLKAQDEALAKGLSVGRSKQASPPNDAAATAIQSPGGAAA